MPLWLGGFPGGSAGKASTCNVGDLGSIPGLGQSPEGGKGYPLQCSGLENSTGSIVHGVAKSWTHFHFHLWVGGKGPGCRDSSGTQRVWKKFWTGPSIKGRYIDGHRVCTQFQQVPQALSWISVDKLMPSDSTVRQQPWDFRQNCSSGSRKAFSDGSWGNTQGLAKQTSEISSLTLASQLLQGLTSLTSEKASFSLLERLTLAP